MAALQITLPDGAQREFPAETTPYQIATALSNPQAAARYIVAEITVGDNTMLWDMHRPLAQNCKVTFLMPEDPKALSVLLHSCAHILGAALQKKYNMNLAVGPALEDSFYYEGRRPDGSAIPPADFPEIEKIMEQMIAGRVRFERRDIPKEEALRMFAANPYKVELITTKAAESATVSIYQCGDFIDLCRGPHVPNAGFIKAFQVTKCGSSYFLADSARDSLQRVYGVAFATKDAHKAWKKEMELAALRDHRLIGQKQELFFFNDLSPGSCFFLPRGAMIYNKLIDFMKSQYPKWGFTEVLSPNVFNKTLWEISGHWQNYKDAMFSFDVEGRTFGLKPMNCPGHCLMYLLRPRSYRELPLRFAEFGICHRNELSGALNGLMRVRRFMQDDAHIFVRPDQVEQEIDRALAFMDSVYSIFHLKYTLELSTRPDHYLGQLADWDAAESQLRAALDRFGHPYQINAGDGAFYGPKIDIKILDAMKRATQCATIQLDFQLPQRFNLLYMLPTAGQGSGHEEEESPAASPAPAAAAAAAPAAPATATPATAAAAAAAPVPGGVPSGANAINADLTSATPMGVNPNPNAFGRVVMIHRAILGSLERFIAVICEHYAGKWPFWISPRQLILLPLLENHIPYCREVAELLRARGFNVDVDESNRKLPKKVREAQMANYNMMLVVGQEEVATRTVALRRRDSSEKAAPEKMSLDQLFTELAGIVERHD
ncbi:putative Threonine--tRNA ligase [Paratrimastix pyriformis]|uniref:threonine--tRNA ligase n=1 Tax=Paratrimastix pyriformis TaxID=342808 RepID=A0ABQ8UUP6_9EUKA|nr:putative Threonine--tRNA ligase [Paratrimastix pyriformis]